MPTPEVTALHADLKSIEQLWRDNDEVLSKISKQHQRLQNGEIGQDKLRRWGERLVALYEEAKVLAERKEAACSEALHHLDSVIEQKLPRPGTATTPKQEPQDKPAAASSSSAKRSHSGSAMPVSKKRRLNGAVDRFGFGALEPNTQVCSKTSAEGAVPEEWLLGTVIAFQEGLGKYEIEDADVSDGPQKKTFRTLPQYTIPLPSMEQALADPIAKGTRVLALFPDTTCFYSAKVEQDPKKRKTQDYLLEFEDDELDPTGKVVKRPVHPSYVVAYPSA